MKKKVIKNPAAKGKINPISKSKAIEQFGYPSISQRIEFDGGKKRKTYFSGTLKISDYEYAVIYERLFTKETKNINSFIKKELNVTESQFIFNPLKELIFKRCINLYPAPEKIETYTREIINEYIAPLSILKGINVNPEKAKKDLETLKRKNQRRRFKEDNPLKKFYVNLYMKIKKNKSKISERDLIIREIKENIDKGNEFEFDKYDPQKNYNRVIKWIKDNQTELNEIIL